jgi:hypothetical protein
MNTIETWRWRILWGGRWKTAPHHWTEAEIRREHPEAERVPGSMLLRPPPDDALTPNHRPAAEMDPRIAPGWEAWQKRRNA